MPLRMWSYDVAREQSPSLDFLQRLATLSEEAGYNALGLYFEHRFAYPSTPWSHGVGSVTPEMIRALEQAHPNLQIIPFPNLLGHFEGMLYTEEGWRYAEQRFKGMQACPSKPEFLELAHKVLDDTIASFSSSIIHIGGDETFQLACCPECQKRAEQAAAEGKDGKARVYGEHFGPLARRVLDAGRRPAIWGDMFLEHPEALEFMPKETLIFDWNYFGSPRETSLQFIEKGFEVVCCPTLHVYNSTWMHLPQSEQNVRDNVEAAEELGAYGVCVTTWEGALMANYGTLLPAIRAAGEELRTLETSQAEAPKRETSLFETVHQASIVYEPTEQLLDPVSARGSISEQMSDSILIKAHDALARAILIEPGDDGYSIRFLTDRFHEVGRFPLEQIAIVRRLQLLSNISPLSSGTQHGALRATIQGHPVRYSVTLRHRAEGPMISLWRETAGGQGPAESNYKELSEAPGFLRAYLRESERHEEWARLMGVELPQIGGVFGYSGIRSSLKCRLLLYSNPFLAWLHHREELCGEIGDKALEVLERAVAVAPNSNYRGVSEFVRMAVEFVRYAEDAHLAYAQRSPGAAAAQLMPCRQIFENIAKIAQAAHLSVGGSLADVERCFVAREHVERVIRRIKQYGEGSLGYLPSFEMITHPKFVPHDQAAWWLINTWANE